MPEKKKKILIRKFTTIHLSLTILMASLIIISGCAEKNTSPLQTDNPTIIEFLPSAPPDWTAKEPQGFMYAAENRGCSWENSILENVSKNADCNIFVTNFLFQDDFEGVLFNNKSNLTTPTYDGSGQAQHPDIFYKASGWNGYKYWMVMAPFPKKNGDKENPSILVSDNGISWQGPPGLTNPLDEDPSGVGVTEPHNNDPDIVYNESSGTMMVYYLESGIGTTYLRLRSSTNGITWSNESTPIVVPDFYMLSPSLEKVGALYYLWYVNSSTAGGGAKATTIEYRTSPNGRNWSDITTVDLTIPGKIPWHIDVRYIPSLSEYWMVISAGTRVGYDDTNGNELYFATSANGLNWTVYPGKLLRKGKSGNWDDQKIYRSSIAYIDDKVKIWYSASNTGNQFRTGYAETTLSDLRRGYYWVYAKNSWSYGMLSKNTSVLNTGSASGYMEVDGIRSLEIQRNVSYGHTNVNFEMYLYDDGDTSGMKLLRIVNDTEKMVGIGVWAGANTTNYVYHNTLYSYTVTTVPRSAGWHKFRMFIQQDATVKFYIDDVKVGTLASQFTNPIYAQLSGVIFSGVYNVDDLNVYRYTTGNLTTWYDAGPGNETYELEVNITTPAYTNYSILYRRNGTSNFMQVGDVYTGNNTIQLNLRFQKTDVRAVLRGNQMVTPELISITYYTKRV